MAVTDLSDIIDPEVIAELTTDILLKETLLLNSLYVKDGTEDVYKDGGNTLTFPQWTTTVEGVVQDQVSTRTGVTPSKLSMDSYEEPVVDKIISFDVNKRVFKDIVSSANPNQHMAEVVASQSAAEIQSKLILRANDTPLVNETAYLSGTAGSQILTVDGILRAKMAWGEKAAGKFPGLFVHSNQFTDLAQTSDYKTLGTATTDNAIVKAQAEKGAVAMVHGCLIYLLDSITIKGGTVDTITRSGSTATVTTTAAHNFKAGDKVVMSGATQTEYNGTFTILAVTSTTFTYTVSGTPATPATGAPAITNRYESLLCLPEAMGLVIKQGIEAEQHKHAGSPVLTFDFDFRYCPTLRRLAPRPVVRYSTRSAQ